MQKIFVYAFKPFGKYKHNVSEEVLRKIPKKSGIKKIVFPVGFKQEIVSTPIERWKPDFILGLGQCPAEAKIRIERKAKNQWKKSKASPIRPITKRGSASYAASWKIPADRQSRISRNAGWFACNFSMYVIARWAEKNGKQFAFLHIPEQYDPKKASRFVQRTIRRIQK